MDDKRKTILISELLMMDDLLLLRKFLADKYIVLEASDGEKAIDIARSQKPDLILMDIMIQKTGGYAACYAVKNDQVTRAIPVVMLAGVGYELNKELSRQMGADGYVTKPFNSQELRDMIGQFFGKS